MCENKRTRKCNWIKSLRKKNLKPKIISVNESLTESQAKSMEIELISRMRDLVGDKLLNLHSGGSLPPKIYGRNPFEVAPTLYRRILETRKRKRVHQLDGDGNVLNTFDSVADAVRSVASLTEWNEINARTGNIIKVCKGQRPSAFGFKWSYEEDGQ